MSYQFRALALILLLLAVPGLAAGQTVSFLDQEGNPTSTYLETGVAFIQVEDPAQAGYTSVDVVVTSAQGGDSETLQLPVTEPFFGVFGGLIALDRNGVPAADGRLQTAAVAGPPFTRDTIVADYVGAESASAGLVGSNVRFLDAQGLTATLFAQDLELGLEIVDHLIDDPLVQDSFTIQVPPTCCEVLMTETGLHTGVFRGTGYAYGWEGSPMTAVHGDADGGTSSQASAEVRVSTVHFLDAEGRATSTVAESSTVAVRMANLQVNFDPWSRETVQVDVSSLLTGDSETLTLTETTPDSSVFEGLLGLALAAAVPGDGVLQTSEDAGPPHAFDALTAAYTDIFGTASATATTRASRIWFAGEIGQPMTYLANGRDVRVRVEDHSADRSGARDTVTIGLTSSTGDSETLVLDEVGFASGVFEGTIRSDTGGSAFPDDGSLQSYWDQIVTATHQDEMGFTSSSATATTLSLAVTFFNADGRPTDVVTGDVAGVRVLDPFFGGPSQVDAHSIYLLGLVHGDSELLQLVETGASTGVYEGRIPLAHGAAPLSSNGVLEVDAVSEPLRAEVPWMGFGLGRATPSSRVAFLYAGGAEAASYAIGETLYLRVVDAAADADPGAADSVVATVSSFDDSETVLLTETGDDTGVFEGQLRSDWNWTSPGDGVLTISDRGTVEAVHPLADGSSSSSRAAAGFFRAEVLGTVEAPAPAIFQSAPLRLRILQPTDIFGFQPSAADEIFPELSTTFGGDQETMTVTETGLATTVFEGSIDTARGTAQPWSSTVDLTEDAGPPYKTDLIEVRMTDYTGSTQIASVGTVGSRTRLRTSYGEYSDTVVVGETLQVEVEDWNVPSPTSITLEVYNYGFLQDSETVTLGWGGSGLRVGTIPTGPFPGGSEDGVLQGYFGDEIVAVHTDALGATQSEARAVFAQTRIDILNRYDRATGEVVEGSTVRFRVFDFDADTSPSPDSIQVDVKTFYSSFQTSATAVETSGSTGVFEGEVRLASPFAAGVPTATSGSPFYLPEKLLVGYNYQGTSADVLPARLTFVDLDGFPVESLAQRGAANLYLEDGNRNDPATVDSLTVTLDATSGDSESVTLVETGPDTGVFTGALDTNELGAFPGDGVLTAAPGEIVRALHPHYGPGTATARVWIEPRFAPDAVDDSAVTLVDQAIVLDVLQNDSDPESEPLTLVFATSQPANGTLVRTGDLFTYTPDASFQGTDTFTYRIADAQGLGDAATVTIVVNSPPSVAISAPADGSTFLAGEIVAFTASASDAEDGDLTGAISWTSSLNGLLGSGGFIQGFLSVGTHTITAAVSDSHGAPAADQIVVTITTNTAPAAAITAPADGSASTETDSVTFTGSASDAEDGDLTASLSWTSSRDGAIGGGGSFSTATLSVGTHTITASVTDSQSATGSSSITVTVNANTAPSAAITAPADLSASTETDPVTFTGTASDAEDGDLTASLQWTSSLDGAIGSGGSFTTSALSVGSHTITASVTDSHGAPASAQITVVVNANAVPSLSLAAPADGSVVTDGTNVTFTGSATDVEDGDLTASLQWTSSLDGAIGNGGSVTTAALSLGVHTITASVTDSHGAPNSVAITVTIHAVPTAAITAPADGASSTETDPVTFTGSASDAEDGDLTANLSWTSSLDGAIGSGGSFATAALSVGVHTITASVSDSQGVPASDQVTFTVNANTAPTTAITAPADGSVVTQGTSVTFTGTASDAEDGDLTVSLQWTSSLDGAIGSGATFATAALSVGVHTVTASVTDSHGGSGSSSVTVTINAAPTVAITAPADGSSSTETDPVTFTGSASDAEDGDLSANLSWTSSLDGAVGSGATFMTGALSIGTHTITASVSDSQGVPASAQITVTVNANAAPSVAVTGPADGSVFHQGSNVNFTGSASDAEDGDLTVSLSWTSSLDGALGTGGSFSTAALSLGTHVVTAAVTDSHGAPASAQVTLRINAAPTLTVVAPADGSVFATGEEVTFAATAADLEDGDLGTAVAWTSSLDGALGTGGSIATSALSAGTHVVTAAVADSDGAAASDLVTVVVKVPVTVAFTSIAVEDGHVRESDETSSVGGQVQATGSAGNKGIRVGDDRKDRQLMGFVSFDTSSIPDGATLRTATLRLRREKDNGSNPFTTHGQLKVDIETGAFSGLNELEATDFEAAATATGVAVLSDAPLDGDWSEGDLDATGLGAVNVGGRTQLRLYFELDDNDDRGNDYLEYYSADEDPASHPQLVVEYLD